MTGGIKKSFLNKWLPGLLYAIPVLFFIICYFLMITSGEDIWQGAASNVDIFNDAIAAFNHSVRLADMFAWSIINFFDYHFQFGSDTILRLLDVAAAFLIFYMATYIVLRRRPRYRLMDATVFCGIFLAVFLTSNGFNLYAGFSKAHNYLCIVFFTLAFGIFYLRDLWGRKAPKSKLFPLFMLVLGFLFGFASNVTAVVFLVTLVGYAFYYCISQKSFITPLKSFFFSWRTFGVIGIILSILLMYCVGNGLGDYETDPVYIITCDYIPIARLFDFGLLGDNIIRIIKHNAFNFGRFVAPFIVAIIPVVIYTVASHTRPQFAKLKPYKNYLIATIMFVFFHVLAMSQIYYLSRLMLPAYFVGVAMLFFVVGTVIPLKSDKILPAVSVIFLCLATILTIAKFYFSMSYVTKIVPILDDIKNSESSTYCVSKEDAAAKTIPYIHLGQEDFLTDWAMPQTIYKKTITYCN